MATSATDLRCLAKVLMSNKSTSSTLTFLRSSNTQQSEIRQRIPFYITHCELRRHHNILPPAYFHQQIMATAAFIPQHQLSEETSHSRSIAIEGWKVTATARPIINAAETDALQKTLGFPLPEMTFGNNSLNIIHKPSGWEYRFDTVEALKWVKNGELGDGDGGVKVGYADAWLKSR